MVKIAFVIRIPEPIGADDAVSSLMQDVTFVNDLGSVIAGAVADWVEDKVEGVTWEDVEVRPA